MSERKALCPNCGAEIVFRWAAAIQTTCPACKSILVRHDADLQSVGKKTDVPPSMSRIQLGTEGKFKGKNFLVIGRIVYRYGRGHWSEWHIRLGGESAWLSDAQGDYVVTKQTPMGDWKPAADDLYPGGVIERGGTQWTIASVTEASYVGVEGELPFEYWDKTDSTFVDLKTGSDGFATVDFSEEPPLFFVGEYESFEELRFSNLRPADADEHAPAKTRGVNCTACGAAIELRLGDEAVTVACVACGAMMDPHDPNLALIQGAKKQERFIQPPIPLGSKASLKGVMFTAIGYQLRSITVEGVDYSWREYLLWNPDQGFRYLSEYEGHWNDISTIKGAPTQTSGGSQPTVEYLGRQFKHFQAAVAVTKVALGEFPWEVRVGDRVGTDDYVSPPLMLSREQTAEEVTWSLGTYTDPERIRQAFKLKDPLRKPSGTFANQPNPHAGWTGSYFKVFALLLIGLVGLYVWRHGSASNKQVFSDYYSDTPRVPAFVTRVFDVPGGSGNVEITIDTDLNQDWAFFQLALLDEQGGKGYEIGREVSYYHGVDGGESWREGSSSDRAMLAAVPGGRYYLRVDVQRSGSGRPFRYGITVKRDVPRLWPFFAAFVVLLIPPIFAAAREHSFESSRWAESDYAPEESDDDE